MTAEIFKKWPKSWFSDKVSTESMMRGSANESAVTHYLIKKDIVSAVFDFGMVCHNEYKHLACPPDGVTLLKKGLSLRLLVFNDGGLRVNDEPMWLATVEVKTTVASSTLGGALELVTTEIVYCDMGDQTSHEYIGPEHISQALHQAAILRPSYAIYIVASQIGVLYTVIAPESEGQLQTTLSVLNNIVSPIMRLAHLTVVLYLHSLTYQSWNDEEQAYLLEDYQFPCPSA